MAGFDVLTMQDIYKDRGPRRYAVERVNEMPSVNILYGTPTTMKSMLLADKVHCILNGIPWLQNDQGVPAIKTTTVGVLWVDFDNGKRRTLDRFAAIGRYYGTSKNAPLYVVSCPTDGLNMGSRDSVHRLQDTISKEIGYVVVDNLGYVSGGADENTTAMVPVMGAFRELAERTGCAFEIIHHERKGSGSSTDRAGDRIRGSSSIEGALDRAFRVVRNPGEEIVTIYSVKERDQLLRPMGARFNYKQDARGELMEAWFTGERADTPEFRVEDTILDFVGEKKYNQSEIIDHVKSVSDAGKPAVIKALGWLVNSEKLVMVPEGKGKPTYYSRPPIVEPLDKFTDIVRYNHEIKVTH